MKAAAKTFYHYARGDEQYTEQNGTPRNRDGFKGRSTNTLKRTLKFPGREIVYSMTV